VCEQWINWIIFSVAVICSVSLELTEVERSKYAAWEDDDVSVIDFCFEARI
jgi:hypothetical protein